MEYGSSSGSGGGRILGFVLVILLIGGLIGGAWWLFSQNKEVVVIDVPQARLLFKIVDAQNNKELGADFFVFSQKNDSLSLIKKGIHVPGGWTAVNVSLNLSLLTYGILPHEYYTNKFVLSPILESGSDTKFVLKLYRVEKNLSVDFGNVSFKKGQENNVSMSFATNKSFRQAVVCARYSFGVVSWQLEGGLFSPIPKRWNDPDHKGLEILDDCYKSGLSVMNQNKTIHVIVRTADVINANDFIQFVVLDRDNDLSESGDKGDVTELSDGTDVGAPDFNTTLWIVPR